MDAVPVFMMFPTVSSCSDGRTRWKPKQQLKGQQSSSGGRKVNGGHQLVGRDLTVHPDVLEVEPRRVTHDGDGMIHSWTRCDILFLFISLKYSSHVSPEVTAHQMLNKCSLRKRLKITPTPWRHALSVKGEISQINGRHQPVLLPHMWVLVMSPASKQKHRWA